MKVYSYTFSSLVFFHVYNSGALSTLFGKRLNIQGSHYHIGNVMSHNTYQIDDQRAELAGKSEHIDRLKLYLWKDKNVLTHLPILLYFNVTVT